MRCPYGNCTWEIEHERRTQWGNQAFWHGHDVLFLGLDVRGDDLADRLHRFVRDAHHADPFTMPEHTLDQPTCRN